MKLTLNAKEIKIEPNEAGGIDVDIDLSVKDTVQLLQSLLTKIIAPYELAEDVAQRAIRRMVDAQEYQKRKYNDPFLTAILAPYQENEGGAEDETD